MSACCNEYPNCIHSGYGYKANDEKAKSNLFAEADKPEHFDYLIPDDKIEAFKEYYRLLRSKFPHIKQDRLIRKTAEHFHLKKQKVEA